MIPKESIAELTKTEAKEILKKHLYWHGLSSQYEDELGFVSQYQLNEKIRLAQQWIEKNYPYLIEV